MEKVIMPKRPQFWRVVLKNELENIEIRTNKRTALALLNKGTFEGQLSGHSGLQRRDVLFVYSEATKKEIWKK